MGMTMNTEHTHTTAAIADCALQHFGGYSLCSALSMAAHKLGYGANSTEFETALEAGQAVDPNAVRSTKAVLEDLVWCYKDSTWQQARAAQAEAEAVDFQVWQYCAGLHLQPKDDAVDEWAHWLCDGDQLVVGLVAVSAYSDGIPSEYWLMPEFTDILTDTLPTDSAVVGEAAITAQARALVKAYLAIQAEAVV